MYVSEIPEINRLSAAEKILLVEDLWDSIAADQSNVPVPDSHVKELDKRLASYASRPGSLLSIDELSSRIEKRR
jgi:putative addiction module component (TIGR02574 family)